MEKYFLKSPDNGRTDQTKLLKQYLEMSKVTVLKHPLYSPDLVLSDYFLISLPFISLEKTVISGFWEHYAQCNSGAERSSKRVDFINVSNNEKQHLYLVAKKNHFIETDFYKVKKFINFLNLLCICILFIDFWIEVTHFFFNIIDLTMKVYQWLSHLNNKKEMRNIIATIKEMSIYRTKGRSSYRVRWICKTNF